MRPLEASATTQQTRADSLTSGVVGDARRSLLARAAPYLLIAPTFILVAIFTILPSINTIIDSLYEPGRARNDPDTFVGSENYLDLFDSSHYLGSRFLTVLGNTLIFTAATVSFSVPLALLFAVLLNRRIRGLGLWRFSLFYPALLPMIGGASFFAFIYADSVGLANAVLRSLGLGTQNWIGNPNLVLFAVTLVNIWKQVGYYMLFYLAGMQNIPRDLYEAAGLDGAGAWGQFRYLTLPLLRRTTLFILVVSIPLAFQTVEQLEPLGRGLPADRANLMLWFIAQNIGERRNWGYVNAMSLILVVMLLIFTVSNFLTFERKGDEHA
jgi:sn-glycerol 3-phosphate transport system permease protein